MTVQMLSKKKPIHWAFVTTLSAGLIAFICLAGLLWPQPERLPIPPRIVEAPPPFVPSRAFEAVNDLAVLRAVLERSCKEDTPEILSTETEGRLGNRSSHEPGMFPEGLGCPGVRIVDSRELEALFNKPYRGKRDFKHQGGWGNFYSAYPDASGLLRLSLPSYPSPTSAIVSLGRSCGYLCGAGWEVTLAKVNGKWVIRWQRPTWIA